MHVVWIKIRSPHLLPIFYRCFVVAAFPRGDYKTPRKAFPRGDYKTPTENREQVRRSNFNSNMTSFKRFESKPVVKIINTYTHCSLWRHRQFIAIFYQFLHIRIEIIHGSHMYILFLQRVGLYVSFLPLANARDKTSWHKGLPVVKTIYTYRFHELFRKLDWFISI